MKKQLSFILLIILFLISGYYLYKYIEFSKNYVSSEAVFVKSESFTNLAFKYGGKIDNIFAKEGERVKKGDIIATLNNKELVLNKEKISFKLKALANDLNSLRLTKQKLFNELNLKLKLNKVSKEKLLNSINAKEFQIKAKKITLNRLKKDYSRVEKLIKTKSVSQEKFDKTKNIYLAMIEEINSDKKLLDSLKKDKNKLHLEYQLIKNSFLQLKELDEKILSLKSNIKALKKDLLIVKEKIKDSVLKAPFDAIVAKKFANNSEIINGGFKIISIVDINDIYVLNMIEETKIKNIKKGSEAKIYIDALKEEFDGFVDEILPVSASTFALVPRDISSGEFTKLSQRFYIKLKFKQIPKNIKIGMGGKVTIKLILD